MFKPLYTAALAFLCLALANSLSARAGDEGLYPAAPPPGSAFVRFLNGDSNSTGANVQVRGKSYGIATLGKVTAYAPVPKGPTSLSLGQKTASPVLEEGGHYTVLLTKSDISILEEPPGGNKLKAQVMLINASSTRNLALKTADGLTSIIDGVDTAELGSRAVNSVSIPFGVYAAEKKIASLAAKTLERGERYAVVVYDGDDGKPMVNIN